jgi:hypothetical protein
MNDEKFELYKHSFYDYEIQSNLSASADNEVGGLARKYFCFGLLNLNKVLEG